MQYIANGLAAGSLVALVAVGFSLIYATQRFFNFAYGAAFIGGGYAGYLLVAKMHSGPWACLGLAALVGSIIGLGTERLVFLPLARRRASQTMLLLSSLGLLIVVQNTISLMFGDATAVFSSGIGGGIVLFSARLTGIQLATVAAGVVVPLTLGLWLRVTRIGLQLRAWMQDPDLAFAKGTELWLVSLVAVAVASAIGGFAAGLAGLDTNLTPLSGFRAILTGSVAAIVGGVGKPLGSYVGGMFVGMTQSVAIIWLPSAWQESMVFFVLLLWLIISSARVSRLRVVN